MNRRIRRKRAKQLARAATAALTDTVLLRDAVNRLKPTGPVTEAMRHRALFRIARKTGEAETLLREASRLTRTFPSEEA